MKRFTLPRLVGTTSAMLAAMIAALPANAGDGSDLHVLDNPGDPHFNQLLGINNSRIIVGYFGDGTVVANNGYVLVPSNHYSVENFTNLPAGDKASQTQAIGINQDSKIPKIVGFYTDANTGFTHGFLDYNGAQITVDDPLGNASKVAAPAQNLLSVNDTGKASGFWTDNSGATHGFVVSYNSSFTSLSFTEVSPSQFKGAVSTVVSNINNQEEICGFWTDKNGVSHGFFGGLGHQYTTFDVEISGKKAANTQAFGCNNNGEIVGQFADSSGELHGFTYKAGEFQQFDAPGSSQTAVFGVQGTLINGVNDLGDFVGFYSNGTSKVKSFVNYSGD